ncbi:hypothetical protein WAI453_002847 [Rhynchosporium graminicola]
MKIGTTYYSAESADGIYVRAASSLEGLGAANVQRQKVWDNTIGDVWAPEITTDLGRTFIHFSAGKDAAHRMYVISADSPLGTYSAHQKLALPNDQWAIDGTFFVFQGEGWFVWSGWDSVSNNQEQNLYICRMDSPSRPVGERFIISQPRESWEQADRPLINEGAEAIIDPNGQLHIVYSANGSWDNNYCLADLRLRKGGNPRNVWDWYKSNGCLFGSHQNRMMSGWDATLYIDGPGHHTFALVDGDINKSPGELPELDKIGHRLRTYCICDKAEGSFRIDVSYIKSNQSTIPSKPSTQYLVHQVLTMQFFTTIQLFALLATGVLAMPGTTEARDSVLEQRADCSRILPACNGGKIAGQTNCRCRGQKETCDLWTCPGGAPNVMVCGQAGTGCVWV